MHPGARIVGIDENEAMLAAARLDADLRVSRLEDPPPDFDRPDPLGAQLRWLVEAGFETERTWAWKDLAVVRADLPG